jgi:hypothetical protein
MQAHRTKLLLALVVGMFVVIVWLSVRLLGARVDESPGPRTASVSTEQADEHARGRRSDASSTTSRSSAVQARIAAARRERPERDALRSKILAAASAPTPADRVADRARALTDDPPPPGQMRDRVGGREALLAQLNLDFMPLVDECIELATHDGRAPSGMLALGVETVADDQLGAIVEAVDLQPGNEIDDPALIECIQETALSLILPPPPEGGSEAFMLTIPITAE